MSTKVKLAKLRGIRGHLKRSLSKLASFTETLVETVTLEVLEVRMEKVNEIWQEFKESQNSLYEFDDQEGYVDPSGEYEEFESKYLIVKSILLAAIRERAPLNQPDNVVTRLAEQQAAAVERLAEQQAIITERINNSTTSSLPQQADTCLPKIRIEPFTGNYREWTTFRDMFEGSIHNRTNLSPTQKFHLLKSHLRGEALNLLSHITISDATYTQAWERLENRYDRPRHIINNFIKSFFELPSLNATNVTTLRKLSDGADEIVRGLTSINSLDRDPWLIYLLLNKVDAETRQAWSEHSVEEEYPTVDKFLTFLARRCEALESCRGHGRETRSRTTSSSVRSMHAASSITCFKCSGSHQVSHCAEFLALDIEAKRAFVKASKLCYNCLRSGHPSVRCPSKLRCKTCNNRHHSLVHFDLPNLVSNSSISAVSFQAGTSRSSHSSSQSVSDDIVNNNHSLSATPRLQQTLLPTALGKVLDSSGKYQAVRFLLDSGSQVSFISEACVQRLGLNRHNARVLINGIGSTNAGKSRGVVTMSLASRFELAAISVDAYVLPKITSNLPSFSFDIQDWDHLNKIQLADSSFNRSAPIDMLLGADRVWDVLQGEFLYSKKGYPIAQKTIFGWVLAGRLTKEYQEGEVRSHHIILDVDSILQAFWSLEEVDPKSFCTQEEKDIEEHFLKTHRRDQTGRFIVDLPFKRPPRFLGTLKGAVARLSSMERKFLKDDNLRKGYNQFIDEYLSLGHMCRITPSEIVKENVFYLPHHAVLKPESISTKIRVVFDGSFRDANGNSLNECLMVGPPIQRNLFAVSLRFRRFKFVFTADIIKMFRQIWISERDRKFLRIVWRKSPNDPLEHYELCTVTYGTSCAPFQSIRVLEQLAHDHRKEFPIAAEVVENDFYVDDVASGADTLEDALAKKQSLVELLLKGGFELSKWQSNCLELLTGRSNMQDECISLDSDVDPWVKVLGLYWNSKTDVFSYRLNLKPISRVTKRQILRDVASIFDPLGFLAPSVIVLKIIFQDLWHRKLEWDDEVPDCISTKWLHHREEFSSLTKLAIPRPFGLAGAAFQLHGFSDASKAAYGAVIYSRYQLPTGQYATSILAAKTRVAPLKQLSIPRLELCAALLLARLLEAVQKALRITFSSVFAWSDSQVVLSWLSSPCRRWDTFVGNRTAEILNSIPRNRWFHIRSEYNPADCASRGIAPTKLLDHPIWWHGPDWLVKDEDQWPISHKFEEHPDCVTEERKPTKQSLLVVTSEHPYEHLANSLTSWYKLIRSVAFLCRFTANCRRHNTNKARSLRIATQPLDFAISLKAEEFYNAKLRLIKWLQATYFGQDIEHFKKFGKFPTNSKILSLNPFLDEEQILRVGGRIEEANICYSAKHPIIIPKQHRITRLILIDAHRRFLHSGVSTLFVLIRQEYWVIGCRNLLRQISHECVSCVRQRKGTAKQMMGNLPPPRIHASRPFTHCGCDYAGPIAIRTKFGRKSHVTKGYISLFVCLATKAIHVELVSDLTTDAFLAALRRFAARRGKPSHMYSDNGTNFRGAARALSEMHKLVLSKHHNSLVEETLARDGISWHFIPPSAPHFGGLWEAGVKSVKYHLRRVIGEDVLTFEQLYTLLTQVEAILNSRPLCRISDNDIDPLTPAHFFLGQPYSSIPEPSMDVPTNRLSTWQSIQAKVQGYWKRWHMEYLTSLQNRPKWQQKQQDLKIDDIVLVKDTNLPPGKWLMGRVTELHPGKDGCVRVVTLKTASGSYRRPIHKLAVLPLC